MDAVEVLRRQSELASLEMQTALDGVTQGQSWAVLPNSGPDYLHSDGSIYGITLHVAVCKVAYGSVAFCGSEVRWRDLAKRVEEFEPGWPAALDYLNEAQEYWMRSWSSLSDGDLEREVPHFSGKTWPAWRIVREMVHHDSYHAGQIAVLRYGVSETDRPPASVAEDIRTHCKDLPSW